jgi:hypothetical protein
VTIGSQARRPIRESPFWRAYSASRYAYLFYSLLLMLVAMPVATMLGFPRIVIRLLFSACLVAAVMPNATPRSRYLLLAAVLLCVAVGFASEREDVPISTGLTAALFAVVGLTAAGGALRFAVTSSDQVYSEAIYAALSTYLLMGVCFGQLHLSIADGWPGSYSGADEFSDVSAVYFSFVTLATLGYGDILPRSDLARGVAVIEVIGGQLFLAVMVARLIGLFPAVEQEP